MRRRRLLVLVTALLALGGAGTFAYVSATGVKGSAGQTAAAYFEAWQGGYPDTMRDLVADPPADFVQRHLGLNEELRVEKLELRPGAVRSTGEETAEVAFAGTRTITEMGPWPFQGTLRLAVRGTKWKVLWAPETLHPALKDGGSVTLDEIKVPGVELVTKSGIKMPFNSGAEPYLMELNERLGTVNSGWAINARTAGGQVRRLVVYQPPPARQVRTTLSRPVQAAAARALDGVRQPAAVVAVRASTGEILAIADRLGGERAALQTLYPPGSAFKVVTAAGLLAAGLRPDSVVPCPGATRLPGGMHEFLNPEGKDRGDLPFGTAFTQPCNTTFVEQVGSRLKAPGLAALAKNWGFDGKGLATGVGGLCGSASPADAPDKIGAAAMGTGSVKATPLCMAVAAAAVDSGTWRAPRLVTVKAARKLDGAPPKGAELDGRVTEGLRAMMRQAVVPGSTVGRGLPGGVSGVTGTAEPADGGRKHAWFVGFRGDVAFSVLVENGGSGDTAALPIAARFLKGL
ncbi:penicillin-binding transpeptidase domain-containing protein [Nonomuraea sp. NPDC046570]|uniref:penicillin-binding transpeptidase domain-containing protein n=1 Tax=Nonomuraea sp. NPDC046570 TaxID=3155255 RepID=UPI0033D9F74C